MNDDDISEELVSQLFIIKYTFILINYYKYNIYSIIYIS